MQLPNANSSKSRQEELAALEEAPRRRTRCADTDQARDESSSQSRPFKGLSKKARQTGLGPLQRSSKTRVVSFCLFFFEWVEKDKGASWV